MTEMNSTPKWTEAERLSALERCQILDTPAEAAFDDVVRMAAELLDVPMAAVSLITSDRQWFKAETGLGIRQTPIDQSICARAMLLSDGLVVPDTTVDMRFQSNTLVTGEPHLRFYAGERLESPAGLPLGMLCALDIKPRPAGLTAQQRFFLKTLARQVSSQLELRRAVAEREQALERLIRTEALTRQVVDSATDTIIISTDLLGRVTTWNAGAAKVLGWTSTEMLGQTIERMLLSNDRRADRFGSGPRSAPATGRPVDERWYSRKDGSLFWGVGAIMPLMADDGTAIGSVSVLRDQTEERRREQRLVMLSQASAGLLVATNPDEVLGPILRESANLLDFDQSCSFVLAPDQTHLCLTYSTGVSESVHASLAFTPFGAVLDGLVAAMRQRLVIDDLQATTEARFQPGRDAGLNTYAGFPVLADGRLYGVLSFGCFSRSRFDNEAIAFFSTLASYLSVVRARLENEAALRHLADTLEHRVEERTRVLRLTEDQLRQSQKMEAVGQLTGGLAHDFNNLLTGVSGNLELARMRLNQGRIDEIERHVVTAQGATSRASALTHRLLAFSRRQTLDPKPVDANQLIESLEELVQRTVGPGIIIDVAPAADLWTTLVDPNQLENALLNLCINARDAMPRGGRLTIETVNRLINDHAGLESDLLPGEYVCISVTDTGTGMSGEVIARAFDPFFTTKPIGMGTGLGLSMIHGFVGQSGGHVRIDSELGRGTRVCLYLPRHMGGTAGPDATAHQIEAPRASQGEAVLVVDDEPTVRMLVGEVLDELDYAVIEAADGVSGLKVLRSPRRIDLLVTDVGLPGGINGRQLADSARTLRPHLKVLFITGYAENAVLRHGHLDAGMHVLTKPFAVEALATRIKVILTEDQEKVVG